MREHWSYSKQNYKDSKGQKWHFVTCSFMSDELDYSETPIEIYFRNNDRTYFGCIRFERKKDNPYKFAKLAEKVMANQEFREQCIAPESEEVWSRNWK